MVRIDAALLIFEDFCALSPEQRATLLARVGKALAPGAALVFDVTAEPRFSKEHPVSRRRLNLDGGFWAEPPYEGTHERFTYPDLRLRLDRYTITKDGETRQFWNWMQCLTRQQVASELATAGFDEFRLFGDVAGEPFSPQGDRFAVIARRP